MQIWGKAENRSIDSSGFAASGWLLASVAA